MLKVGDKHKGRLIFYIDHYLGFVYVFDNEGIFNQNIVVRYVESVRYSNRIQNDV